ncbi:hypothetical protein [Shewanella sp. YLB-07]|uniref:TackOD1 domain-containing metal-binding protein n=1 Tax=Shewanella sp. YLB-07 TaxID=2601268 RepID=UPI00128D0039|nr:hypothetical protein [Shewanella sp. YLB-07]MPY26102.1 hypothetical protein [Shewanella sp. YLB-07]
MLVKGKSNEEDLDQEVLLWLGQEQPKLPDSRFEYFSSSSEIFVEQLTPDLIVLSMQDEAQDEVLMTLRHHELTSHCLILVLQESVLSPYLANGIWNEDYDQQYQTYKSRRQQVKLRYFDDIAYKLLVYLWLHPEFTLTPHSVPSTRTLFNYPLLSSWEMAPEESFSWLISLQRKGWIESSRLINRVRFCDACQSGHLNYIDTCPQCQSIEIEMQSSLHCFNCGHIGKQDSFKKQLGLSCPNCLQDLRHIGVDYDRPIENQHCSSCDSLFIEANVEAECLHCKIHNKLSDLQVRNIYDYCLETGGRRLVRQGKDQGLFALVPGDAMTNTQFDWLINWQNQLAIRHGHDHTIVSLQMLNLNEFLTQEGEAKGFAHLDALLERIRSTIRTTDACTYSTEHGLLLFLPFTEVDQIKVIYSKIFELKSRLTASNIEVKVRAIALPDKNWGDDVQAWLTDKLASAEPL